MSTATSCRGTVVPVLSNIASSTPTPATTVTTRRFTSAWPARNGRSSAYPATTMTLPSSPTRRPSEPMLTPRSRPCWCSCADHIASSRSDGQRLPDRAGAPLGCPFGGVGPPVQHHRHHHRDEHDRVVEQVQLHPRDQQLHDAGRLRRAGQRGAGERLQQKQQMLDVVPEL